MIFYFVIQDLQVKAEEAIKTYKYNQSLQLGDINYTNVRTPYDDWPQHLKDNMEYNEHFKQQVNVNESGVHVPIEIYEGCKFSLSNLDFINSYSYFLSFLISSYITQTCFFYYILSITRRFLVQVV